MVRERGINEVAAVFSQRDEDATGVLGTGLPDDEAITFEAIEPLCGRCGTDHRCSAELDRSELMRWGAASEGGENVKGCRIEAVQGEGFALPSSDVGSQSANASYDAHGGSIEIGSLLAPLG
jgi:hypothetical protein